MNTKLAHPGTVRRITQLLARLHPAGWDSPCMVYGRFLCSLFASLPLSLSPHLSSASPGVSLLYLATCHLLWSPNFLAFAYYLASLISSELSLSLSTLAGLMSELPRISFWKLGNLARTCGHFLFHSLGAVSRTKNNPLFCFAWRIDRIFFLHGYLRTWICHWRAVALMEWVLSTLRLIVDRPLLFFAHTCALMFFCSFFGFMPYFMFF